MSDQNHERHMRRAIELVANCPDRPFGAVIVDRDTGTVVAEGWNRTEEDPTLHGEVDAIRRLFTSGRGTDSARLVLHTTAEPCPMCQGAVLWTGVGQVVFGASIRFLMDMGSRQIDIPAAEVACRAPGWACEVVGAATAADVPGEPPHTPSRSKPRRNKLPSHPFPNSGCMNLAA